VVDLALAFDFAKTRHQGVLVTQKRDGRPQLSNVAYALTDGVVRVSVTADRAKTANLRRDPRASLYVGRDDFWAYAVLEGDAELSAVTTAPDDATAEELVVLYRAVRGEDHPDWAEFRRAMVQERRLVVRLRVTHAYGMTGR
jgi:PPOX class probable F420-dependent enzyme